MIDLETTDRKVLQRSKTRRQKGNETKNSCMMLEQSQGASRTKIAAMIRGGRQS